jgi:hypothetical protein
MTEKEKKSKHFIGLIFWTFMFLILTMSALRHSKPKIEETGYVTFPSDEEIKEIELLNTK